MNGEGFGVWGLGCCFWGLGLRAGCFEFHLGSEFHIDLSYPHTPVGRHAGINGGHQSTLDAVCECVVPWSEFLIVPSYPHYPQVEGLGVSVQGLGLRVQGMGFGVWGLGCRVWNLGFGVQGLIFGV